VDKITEQQAACFRILREIERDQHSINQKIAIKNAMLQQLAQLESEAAQGQGKPQEEGQTG
jgi:hypothetical protein